MNTTNSRVPVVSVNSSLARVDGTAAHYANRQPDPPCSKQILHHQSVALGIHYTTVHRVEKTRSCNELTSRRHFRSIGWAQFKVVVYTSVTMFFYTVYPCIWKCFTQFGIRFTRVRRKCLPCDCFLLCHFSILFYFCLMLQSLNK